MIFSNPPSTIQVLLKYGIRPSVQRIAIMSYLRMHRTHPTVEEIYTALSPEIPTLSKTTVYNTLTLFVEKGAANHITLDPRGARYDGDTSTHGHFLCDVCGELYDVHFSTAPELPDAGGHRVRQAQIYYQGVCECCQTREA